MDWALALLLGIVIVGVIFALPMIMAVVSVLLVPTIILFVVVLGVWFLLKILRDVDDSDKGKGPEP